MRAVRVFGLVVLLLVAAGGTWVALVGELDLSDWRPEVEAAIHAATGRTISIDGELELDLLPLPRLHATGLAFSNADWGSREAMLTANSVDMSVRLRPLFSGDIHVHSIRLGQVDLLLEMNAAGDVNWEFGSGGADDDESVKIFDALRRLDLTMLSVEWRRPGHKPHTAVVDTARLIARSGGFNMSLSGELDGRPISLEGDLSSPIDYLRGRGLRGKVRSKTSKLVGVFEGDLGRFPTGQGMDVTVDASGSRWPILSDLTGLPEGDMPPWDVSFRVTERDGVLDVTGLELDIDASRITGQLQLDRRGDEPRVEGVDVLVDASGESWPYLTGLVGFPQGGLPPWRVALRVTGSQDQLELTEIDALLDESDLAGHGAVDFSGDKPYISGQISAQLLDLSTPARWWQGTLNQPPPEETGGKLFSTEPLQTAWMHEIELKLEIAAEELRTDDLNVDQARAGLTVQSGHLQFDVDALAYGGRGWSRMSADASQSPLQYRQRAEIIDADMRGVTEDWFGEPLIDAKGSFRYDIAGQGGTAAEILSTISGTGLFVIGEGIARAGIAERAVRGLATTAISTILRAQKVDDVNMECFASEIVLTDGIAQFEVLVLRTEGATVIGGGSANLRDETWDLYFKPKPKVFALSAAVPVHMKGPFLEPEITVQKIGLIRKFAGAVGLFVFPPAAVAGLADFGAGNPCVESAAEYESGQMEQDESAGEGE